MKRITQRTAIIVGLQRIQSRTKEDNHPHFRAMYERAKHLDPLACTLEEAVAVANKSWFEVPKCDVCLMEPEAVMEFGVAGEYNFHICDDCMARRSMYGLDLEKESAGHGIRPDLALGLADNLTNLADKIKYDIVGEEDAAASLLREAAAHLYAICLGAGKRSGFLRDYPDVVEVAVQHGHLKRGDYAEPDSTQGLFMGRIEYLTKDMPKKLKIITCFDSDAWLLRGKMMNFLKILEGVLPKRMTIEQPVGFFWQVRYNLSPEGQLWMADARGLSAGVEVKEPRKLYDERQSDQIPFSQ